MMDTNNTTKYVSTSDVEELIDKIMHTDSLPDTYDQYTGLTHVDEALWRLKTLQLIDDTRNNIEQAKRINDAFANPAAKTGWGEDNLINATEYPLTRLTQDWQLLTSLYRTSWIVQRVCNVIPEDALSDLLIEAPGLSMEDMHKLEEECRSTHLRDSLLEALRWGRLYGGAAAIIMISGQEEDLSLPLDINNILPGSFRGLYVVDRWSGIYPSLDLVDNERDPDFGLPAYYEVRDETGGGSYRVHHSRVLRFCGTKMPFWEQVAEQYWGTSAIESMYDELIKRDNVAHNIANLTFKANLSVLQVENLDQMFATSSTVHQRRMYAMLSAINTMENSLGIRLVNKGDDIQQLQYSFSGLPEVMDSAMMDMAGATSIPVTRLFGRSPAGMNSTGESDERMYRQTLEQERAVHITPALEKLIPIVCHSAIGCFPAGASFKYPSLIEIPPQEKVSIVDQTLQPLERLFQANLLPGDAVLEAVRNAQASMDMTSTIRDEHIEHVRGKYAKDLEAGQADPFGGAMQVASEAGTESGADGEYPSDDDEQENDNQNINPQQMTEEQKEQIIKATKPQYESIAKTVSPSVSQDVIVQQAFTEGISPNELKRRLIKQRESLEKEKNLKREYLKVVKSEPGDVAQDMLSELAAKNQIDVNEFAESIQSGQKQPEDNKEENQQDSDDKKGKMDSFSKRIKQNRKRHKSF